jgi:hypothetical protein
MGSVGGRAWFARIALAAALVHVAGVATIVALEAGRRLEIFRLYRHEPFSAAQERLLGAAYLESIRTVRATVSENETVYVIDEETAPAGAAYFALHYLAPRRVVLLGAPRRESPKLVQSRLPADARWVVIVQAPGAPLELVPAERLRPKGARAGS